MAYTTIDDPSAHFQTVLYTGTGSTLSVTNDGNSDLQPDLVWGKDRNVDRHWLADSTREKKDTGYYLLSTSNNEADTSNAPPDGVTAIGSDGFTLGENSSNDEGGWSVEINESSHPYVAWQWKANGGTETHSQSEGGTNLACSTQANTTAGFSIVTYTGSGTSGHGFLHGLGAAPNFVAVKNRSSARDWVCYHTGTSSAAHALFLNGTSGQDDGDDYFPADATSTLVKVGTRNESNEDGDSFIAYCWKDIQGYSKFGGYTGNGDNDGTFAYTGFKPAFVIVKRTDASGDGWRMLDNKRNTFNVTDTVLNANTSTAEATSSLVDFLSNGLKFRNSGDLTVDGATYIYIAFAEQPFVTSGGVPCTAH